jgi:putative restriction endonuclease
MDLADIDRKHVDAAIAEYELLNKADLLAKYGVRPANRFYVMREDWAYEIEAVLTMLPGVDAEEAAAHLDGLGEEIQDRALIPHFGPIPDIEVGRRFRDRRSLRGRQVHREQQSGIVGTKKNGAESIVVSGGYPEDRDDWDIILYTGHGGQAENSTKQVADQTFTARGNAALLQSMAEGDLVRVIRGTHRGAKYGPDEGFRYDGLFRVEDASYGRTGDGNFRICQFRMVKDGYSENLDLVAKAPTEVELLGAEEHAGKPLGNEKPGRRGVWSQRVVRSTAVAKKVKKIHQDRCQACGDQVVFGDQSYSEGAHVQALGTPHDGPDVEGNLLCLCPSCHVRFDLGALIIHDDHSLWLNGQPYGKLRTHPRHRVDPKYLAQHRAAHEKGA